MIDAELSATDACLGVAPLVTPEHRLQTELLDVLNELVYDFDNRHLQKPPTRRLEL
jgi:hypothetical protein